MKETLQFLADLARHNDREWFAANKGRYILAKEKTDLLASHLIAAISEIQPEASRLTPADCTYRIYRDTRFSADKTPYKDHIGIFVNPPRGKKSMMSGYYLHLQPGNCMIGGGQICLPAPLLKAIRQSIVDEIDEYRSIVEDEEFRKLFPGLPGENLLKTAPKGFDKNWPYLDYIRPRDFVITGRLTDGFVTSGSLVERLRPYLEQIARYNAFINYTVEAEGFV